MSDVRRFNLQGRLSSWAALRASTTDVTETRPRDDAMAKAVSQRIDFLRIVLICAIVYIHVPDPMTQTPWLAVVRSVFVDGLFRVGVPVLSAVSGYLLAASLQRRSYPATFKNKLRTLLVPLILWNLPLVVALYFIEARGLTHYQFHAPAYPFSAFNWTDLVFGIEGQPVNYPMYFIRDLFVAFLISPLFMAVSRFSPLVAIGVVTVIFASGIDGVLIMRNEIAINFFVGFLIFRSGFKPTALDAYAVPCLMAAIAAGLLLAIFPHLFRMPFMLMSPWLVWPAASLATRLKGFDTIRRQASSSIAIFVMHAPILMVIWALFGKALTGGEYFAMWLLAPILVISIALMVYRIVHRLAPGVARWSFGSR